MSTTALPAEAKKKCSYEHQDWHCPFDAEGGHDLCIFHLPAEQKAPEDFWRHLANYLLALCRLQDAPVQVQVPSGHPWIVGYEDARLLSYYEQRRPPGGPCFIGFGFPAMDDRHNFQGFAFRDCDSSEAQFSGRADFADARFEGKVDFSNARFHGKASFARARFSGEASFLQAVFAARADFTGTVFAGGALFDEVTFTQTVLFGTSAVNGQVSFQFVKFLGNADFGSGDFAREAVFSNSEFRGQATFARRRFGGLADFRRTEFHDDAFFGQAWFANAAHFENTKFLWDAHFRAVHFAGLADFSMASVAAILDFSQSAIRGTMLFSGIAVGPKSAILLWKLDFEHGGFDLGPDCDSRPQEIQNQTGAAVFSDIKKGTMDCVSFLHTEIMGCSPRVRFVNVDWSRRPKQFIRDAVFVFEPPERWGISVPFERTDELADMFSAPLGERGPSNDLVICIRRDVERIAREIRKYFEFYGSYSDAGDYHVTEMEYRRARAPWFSFQRFLLAGYKRFSLYGESAGRAFAWFLGVWLVSAPLYMYAGFTFGKAGTVRYVLRPDVELAWPVIWRNLADFAHALAYSFVSLIPGYFRLNATQDWPGYFTPFIVVVEAVFGVGLLTLFLLAIRRRFRR